MFEIKRYTVKLLSHGGDMLELCHELRLPFISWLISTQVRRKPLLIITHLNLLFILIYLFFCSWDFGCVFECFLVSRGYMYLYVLPFYRYSRLWISPRSNLPAYNLLLCRNLRSKDMRFHAFIEEQLAILLQIVTFRFMFHGVYECYQRSHAFKHLCLIRNYISKQGDFDIIGGESALTEAEVIKVLLSFAHYATLRSKCIQVAYNLKNIIEFQL